MPLRGARWLRGIDVLLGAAAAVAIVTTIVRSGWGDPWSWTGPAAVAVAAVMAYPIAVVAGRREHRMLLETPVLLPLAWFVPAGPAVLATALGAAIGTFVRLRREGRTDAATVLRTVAVYASAVAVLTAMPLGPVDHPWQVVLALFGLEGVHLAVVLPVPLLRAWANPDALGVSLWHQLRLPLLVTPFAATAAAVVVLLVEAHGAAGLVAYAPIALVLAVGSRLTEAQQDRRRLDALYALAVDGAHVGDGGDALTAAQRVLRRALPGAAVVASDAPPTGGELGARLRCGRWLVVSRTTDGFTPDDADLVAAVGRLATTAAERADALRSLRRRERVQSALLAAAGHDLQTPLTVQQGLAATVRSHRSQLTDDQVDHMLGRIHANSQRMSRTIRGLVDLERLELGAAETDADLAAAVATWWEEARPAGGPPVLLELDERPTPVAMGATYIERVVENLVANAVRHSPEGAPVVVRVVREAATVLLAVEDRGPGVADADKERIFRALDQGSGGVRGSVGLGLFIVLRFVEHGGGRVEVEDRDGGGASFRVRLPLAGIEARTADAAIVTAG